MSIEVEGTRGAAEQQELAAIAQEAYIWGSPLVQFGEYRRQHAYHYAPINRFNAFLSVVDDEFSPSQELLYSYVDFDLAGEPRILSVPRHVGRYFSVQFMDPFFNSFAYVGTRTTGAAGGLFAIVGPGWQGELPEGITPIRCPDNRITAYGRTEVKNKADRVQAAGLVQQYRITSLSHYPDGFQGPFTGGRNQWFPNYRGDKEGTHFFDKLGVELEATPFKPQEAELAQRFRRVGVGPGLRPTEFVDPQLRKILKQGVTSGQERIDNADFTVALNNWTFTLGVTSCIQDPLMRAHVQRFGGGHHVAEEALMVNCRIGPDGNPLSGTRRYRLRFAKDQLPPVHAFWSVCLLGDNGIPIPNPIDRQAISSGQTDIVYTSDGSLDILIQTDDPQSSHGNWLPSPPGKFYLFLRLYLPKKVAIAGEYAPPMLEIVS